MKHFMSFIVFFSIISTFSFSPANATEADSYWTPEKVAVEHGVITIEVDELLKYSRVVIGASRSQRYFHICNPRIYNNIRQFNKNAPTLFTRIVLMLSQDEVWQKGDWQVRDYYDTIAKHALRLHQIVYKFVGSSHFVAYANYCNLRRVKNRSHNRPPEEVPVYWTDEIMLSELNTIKFDLREAENESKILQNLVLIKNSNICDVFSMLAINRIYNRLGEFVLINVLRFGESDRWHQYAPKFTAYSLKVLNEVLLLQQVIYQQTGAVDLAGIEEWCQTNRQ